MASNTVIGYEPEAAPMTLSPVTLNPGDLTLAVLPNGKGLLGWTGGGAYRVEVLDTVHDIFNNNIIDRDTGGRVALTFLGSSLYHGTVWVDQGQLFCGIARRQGNAGWSEVYIADDANDPQTWWLRGTVRYYATSRGGVVDLSEIGPPLVTNSGVWAFPIKYWGNLFGLTDTINIASSTNRGLSWQNFLQFRSGAFDGLDSGPQSTTVAQAPSNGNVYWWYEGGESSTRGMAVSTDGGVTWGEAYRYSAAGNYHPYTDDGTYVYIAHRRSTGYWAMRTTNPSTTPPNWEELGVNLIPVNAGNFRFINCNGVENLQYVIMCSGRVAYRPGGWKIDEVPIG